MTDRKGLLAETHTVVPDALDMDAVLCLVRGEGEAKRCYFTTATITEQWGDDWNDAPHWCNAGEPYTHHGECIYTVAVYGGWFPERYYSADDCNRGRAPWLVDGVWGDDCDKKRIYGGITLRDFVRKCQEYGWALYWPVNGGAR